MTGCIGTPVSWLRLEQYAVGDGGLSAKARADVDAHLDACEACRGCYQRVRDDSVALPPLPATVPAPRAVAWTRWAFGGFAAAAVAAAIVLLLARGGTPGDGWPGQRVAIKGGELAIDLVRERSGAITHTPEGFAPGDRFQVLVTCPPADGPTRVDVVVFQDGEPSFPLAVQRIACGNRITLAGAFRITGAGPARVCVAVDTARDAVAGAPGACLSLRPE